MMNVKTLWEQLPAKKKKWLVWTGGGILLIGALYLLMPDSITPVAGEKQEIIRAVLTDADTAGMSQSAIAARLRSLADAQNKLSDQMNKIVTTFDMQTIDSRLRTIEQELHNEKNQRERLEKRLTDTEKAARQPVVIQGSKNSATQQPSGASQNAELDKIYRTLPQSAVAQTSNSTGHGNTPAIPDIETITATADEKKPDITADADTDAFETYLPPAAIISGVFISGMDAPTSQNARRDPYPALIRIKKDAILPNRFRLDIRECAILASGFGELSSERAYFRSEVISCIRDDGAVFEAPLISFAAGEDGKAGVRGRLVSKQGQLLAKALIAGFLKSASQLFSVQSMPSLNLNTSGDTPNPYQQILNSTTLQGAAISGAGEALNRLADFYMDMAGDIFPIIEIDPGRSVDFIVQKGVMLKFRRTGDKS